MGDLTTEVADKAFERMLRERKGEFFPTPAELRSFVEKPEKEADILEAEKAWLALEKRRDKWGRDLAALFQNGKYVYPKPLDGPTEYALASIGGWERFCDYDHDYYNLMRKQFIEAYSRHRETKGLLAPSREEASRLWGEVSQWERKQLPN